MKEGPDIARLAALIGDPARANMLTALMTGRALTVSELATEAGIGLPTASAHLGKLSDGGLVAQTRQGRHRYFRLSDPEVAAVLEALMGLSAHTGHMRVRTGPKDPELRHARICYDHRAGELGVSMLDALRRRNFVTGAEEMAPSAAGVVFFRDFGIDIGGLSRRRRALCRPCLDWSARRDHLGGALGAALLQRMIGLGWAVRASDSRAIRFSRRGDAEFARQFHPAAAA